MTQIPLSILDRSHLRQGGTTRDALTETIARARHAEQLGFHRFWVAEHHGVPGVASAAPTVLLAGLTRETTTIRLGSGGVMLPNHQPLIIAEQFGVLDVLAPGRIDLGVGRSLGFIKPVRKALRRETYDDTEFRDDLGELLGYLDGMLPVTASPGRGAEVRPFVLASSAGATIAAEFGLPLVIGATRGLVPDDVGETAIDRYRRHFRPSIHADAPHVILLVTALAAATSAEAADLALSEAWAFVDSTSQGAFLPLESPAAIRARDLTPRQQTRMTELTATSITGTGEDVVAQIRALVTEAQADEVMLAGSFFAVDAMLGSDQRIMQAWQTA